MAPYFNKILPLFRAGLGSHSWALGQPAHDEKILMDIPLTLNLELFKAGDGFEVFPRDAWSQVPIGDPPGNLPSSQFLAAP